MAQYIIHTVLSCTLGRAGLISLKTTATLMDAAVWVYSIWKRFTPTGMAPQACGDKVTVFSKPLTRESPLKPLTERSSSPSLQQLAENVHLFQTKHFPGPTLEKRTRKDMDASAR